MPSKHTDVHPEPDTDALFCTTVTHFLSNGDTIEHGHYADEEPKPCRYCDLSRPDPDNAQADDHVNADE